MTRSIDPWKLFRFAMAALVLAWFLIVPRIGGAEPPGREWPRPGGEAMPGCDMKMHQE